MAIEKQAKINNISLNRGPTNIGAKEIKEIPFQCDCHNQSRPLLLHQSAAGNIK